MTAIIAGIDEAGRGPLAGPVVAAAVILNPGKPIEGLADSKKITERKRNALFIQICESALNWSIAEATVAEIDEINILQATFLAMRRAVSQLTMQPTEVLVDGRDTLSIAIPNRAIIGGDAEIPAISAASILAKVHRDKILCELGLEYPEYGFAKHKGYGTQQHLVALKQYGPTPHHRRSFAPVRACT